MKSSAVESALRSLNASACEAAIGETKLAAADDAREFVDCIRRSGCMVVEWQCPASETLRDALAASCREWLAGSGDPSLTAHLDEHLAAARIVESGFRSIESTLSKHPVSARTPAEQVWGLLRWVEGGMKDIDAKVDAALAADTALRDITQVRIRRDDGVEVSPDAVVTGAVSSCGNTLLMLGHRHRLFDKHGRLVLPDEPVLDEAAVEESGALMFLSSAWSQLRRGWERVRFFRANVSAGEHDVQIAEQGARRMTVIEFSNPDAVELLDQVATDRLNRRLLVDSVDISTQTNALQKISSRAGAVPLPPVGWVSLEEINASHSLATHYFWPVDSDAGTAFGVPLKAWLRGYAIYARWLARDENDRPALRIVAYSEADLTAHLTAGGLTGEQARLFIQHTTFGRRSKDLFDAPLIRSADGRLHFVAPAYISPNPGAVLVSTLGRLGARFEDKGKRFERQTLKIFSDAGVPAHSFTYRLDGKKWDCDVAALLDDTLLVFDCKNYGIPDGHLPSLYYFLLQLTSHINQVERIAHQLDQNPEIVREHFGPAASWKRIVPCVLNALPWSAGKLGDVYCYDASALGRFFEHGFIAIKMTKHVEGKTYITRRHKFPLYEGERPTAADLLRELDDPAQLRLPRAHSQITAQLAPLSADMAVLVPEWGTRELTLEQQFRVFGASDQEANRLVQEFSDFPEAVEKARDRVASGGAAGATAGN